MGILSWIVALFILAMINFATGISAIGRFIATCPRITGPGDLSDLKAMVRKQMYRALLQIVLLGGMTVISVTGILTDRISFSQFLMVLILDGIVWFAGKKGKSIEQKAQRLQVDEPELKEEYKSVCRTWVLKPFPDF